MIGRIVIGVAVLALAFAPHIPSESWDVRGRGYHVAPGW